jgi:hypothetical protein
MAIIQNLTIDQGTTWSIIINVTDASGDIKDLTNYTVRSQMRKSYYTNTYIEITTEVSSPLDGEITMSLTAEETAALKSGRYVYDLEIEGNDETLRIIEGIITVNPEVTR